MRTETSTVRAMRGVQFNDRKRLKDLMLILKETIGQMPMTNRVCWYGHVLRREGWPCVGGTLRLKVKRRN